MCVCVARGIRLFAGTEGKDKIIPHRWEKGYRGEGIEQMEPVCTRDLCGQFF